MGVAVCTGDFTAVGYTYCLQGQRLLDVLNRGLDQGLASNQASLRVVVGKDFVPMTDAKILFRTGDQKYLASTHIRKATILFVAEISGGQPETAGIRDLMKVTKKPVSTEVRVPPYYLTGQMHSEIWEQLADHLEGHDKFLPLTNAGVTPKLINVESSFDFVAINKDQVVYIKECNGPTPAVVSKKDQRQKKQKPQAVNGGCLQCGYPVFQSLRWRTYAGDGTLLCRACKSPLP